MTLEKKTPMIPMSPAEETAAGKLEEIAVLLRADPDVPPTAQLAEIVRIAKRS